MAWYNDRWSAEENGWKSNKIYKVDTDNDGNFIIVPKDEYTGQESNEELEKFKYVAGTDKRIKYLYWSTTGDIYYPDEKGVIRKYTRPSDSDLPDLTGDWYVTDDELEAYSKVIEELEKTRYNNILLESNTPVKTTPINTTQDTSNATTEPVPVTGILSIPIPREGSNSSIRLSEYDKNKIEADKLLERMLIRDTYDNEEEKEDDTVYYNHASNLIDLRYLIHNAGTNLQGYLDSKHWSQAQRDAFMKAYNDYKEGLTEQLDKKTQRFSTDDSGKIVDTYGIMSGKEGRYYLDANGNLYNSLDEILDKKLRKSAVVFSPIDLVAIYLKEVGNAIVKAGKVKGKNEDKEEGFDLNEHGFSTFWINKVNPAGGKTDFTPFLALDPVKPDGTRDRTNRLKYFINELRNYADYISHSKFKFSGDVAKSKEEYLKKIEEAITNLGDGWDSADAASLQELGIPAEFYNAFMTEEADPNLTDEQKADARAKRKSEAASDYIDELKKEYDNYINTKVKLSYTFKEDNRFGTNKTGSENLEDWFKSLGFEVSPNAIEELLPNILLFVINGMRSGKTEIPLGNASNLNIEAEILPKLGSRLKLLFKPSSKTNIWFYNDYENDRQYGAVLCYSNGQFEYKFFGDVKDGDAWNEVKNNFESSYYDSGEKPRYSFDKKGGVLRKFAEGGSTEEYELTEEEYERLLKAYLDTNLEENNHDSSEDPYDMKTLVKQGHSIGEAMRISIYGEREDAAKAKGMTYKQYNALQRKPRGIADRYNPDNGQITDVDLARMGAIFVDIGSLVLDPVSGGLANLTSTAANFYADANDESVSTSSMWTNLATNLGLDLLSIIPIVGDAAGTGSKLLKSASWVSKKLIWAVSAWGILDAFANKDEIMTSLKKAASSEKLTVGDWQNIAKGISAVAGINNAVKSRVAKGIARKATVIDDAIGLRVKGKDGKTQDIILRGDKAKKIQLLVQENKITDINDELKSIESLKDFLVNTYLEGIPVGMLMPFRRTTGADGKKHFEGQNPFTVRRKIDSFEIFDGRVSNGYAGHTLLNTRRQDKAGAHYKGDDLLTTAEVLERIKAKQDATEADVREKINEINTERKGIDEVLNGSETEAGLHTKREEIQKNQTDLEESITNNLQRKTELETELNKLNTIGKKTYGNNPDSRDAATKRLNAIEKRLRPEGIDAAINQKKGELERISKKLDKLQKKKLPKSEDIAEIERLKKEKSELRSKVIGLENKKKRYINERDALKLWTKKYDDLQEVSNFLARDNASVLDNYRTQLAEYDTNIADLNTKLEDLNARAEQVRQEAIDKYENRAFVYGESNQGYVPYPSIRERIMSIRRKGGLILKFLKAGTILYPDMRNIEYTEAPDWYNDFIFSDNGKMNLDAKDVYGMINESNYMKYNELLKAYHKLNRQNPESNAILKYSKDVHDYQNAFNNLAGYLNNQFTTMSKLKGHGGTSDKYKDHYTPDGYFGTMTWLRHLGNSEEAADAINEENVLGKNIKARYNNSIGMVLFEYVPDKPSNILVPTPTISRQTLTPEAPVTPATPVQVTTTPELISADAGEILSPFLGHNNNNDKKDDFKSKLKEVSPDLISSARYFLSTRDNARRAKQAIEAILPHLLLPKEDHVVIHGDLFAKAEGKRAMADAMRLARNAISSDADKQMGFQLEQFIKGRQAETAGDLVDNKMYRTTQAADQAQRIKNNEFNHSIAQANNLSLINADSDRVNQKIAIAQQQTADRDKYLQEIEKNMLDKVAEAKSVAKAIYSKEIENAVKYNPNKYGAGLSDQELEVYNSVTFGGKKSADLSSEELKLLVGARSKVDQAHVLQMKKYYGISDTPWSANALLSNAEYYGAIPYTMSVSDPDLITIGKNGTKLQIAKIRERVKNADRFLRSIEKQQELLDKKMARIAKSMNGLPKAKSKSK